MYIFPIFLLENHQLKVRQFGLLFGARKAAMYCDWLSRQSLANQNTVLPGARQAIEKTKWSDITTVTVPKPLNLKN